jgi:agarase
MLTTTALACVVAAANALAAGNPPASGALEPGRAPGGGFTVSADARGVWSFVRPDGERFVSIGVNNVSPAPWRPRPGTDYYNPVPGEFGGDVGKWGAWARGLLTEHGFNTAGSWSDPAVPGGGRLYHTPILYVGGTDFHHCLDALRPDFAERVRTNTVAALAKHPDRAAVLGVFLDNEIAWWGKSGWDRIANYTLLERAMEEAPEHPVRAAAVEFLRERHKTVEGLNAAYGLKLEGFAGLDTATLRRVRGAAIDQDRLGFTALVAERYYRVATENVRAVAPGVLILGTRFAGDVPDPVIVECGRYCDVISFNDYHGDPTAPSDLIARCWVLGKRPVMITEYSWRAAENTSGNPNSAGAGAVIATQAERAERYGKYAAACFGSPVVIGLHWFEFADQSPQGRFDGENSNYGIVDIKNRPYAKLLGAMREANGAVPSRRAGAMPGAPTELPRPAQVTYSPGQHPGRPPVKGLLAGEPAAPPEVWGAPDSALVLSREGEAYVLEYSAGKAYGAGVNFFGPASALVGREAAPATDLDGYRDFVVDVSAPEGLQVNLVLTEAGSGPVGRASYASAAGDDGEAFISEPFYGDGGRQTVRIAIASLKKQAFWGNQAGGNEVQMSAVKCFGFQLQGVPAKGRVVLHSVSLSR